MEVRTSSLVPTVKIIGVFGVRLRLTVMVFALLSFALLGHLQAERNHLKPSDFRPLTSLPWKTEGATMESVLDAIFRETNSSVRYAILGQYLRLIPAGQLGKAFEGCIKRVGTETPDELVAFYLPIWSERDAVACWQRTRGLFRLIGIEDGWLNYDSWTQRDRITVKDLKAIRASSFWLEGWSLATFPLGVQKSALPMAARVRMMREFADTWFAAFGTWPKSNKEGYSEHANSPYSLAEAFEDPVEQLRIRTREVNSLDELTLEITMRRLLEADPASAPQLVAQLRGTRLPPGTGEQKEGFAVPSTELLMVWARCDLAGMIRWAESLDMRGDEVARDIRGFLMGRVDSKTRERWLAEAKSAGPEAGLMENLLCGWAVWDLKSALAAAVATNDADTIEQVGTIGAYGIGYGQPWNACHYGMGVIKDFDVAGLPEELRKKVIETWGIMIMEEWGDIDIGEAARYGLDFLLRNNDYAPRSNLLKLFSGDDKFASDGNMIDRTFCALRVWAVVRPQEMKAWIATRKEQDLRKALTWLLEHPWGGPQK